MNIKFKIGKKLFECDVADKKCKLKKCFSPQKYLHYRQSIDGKSYAERDNYYSCSHRNYHGCPVKEIIKMINSGSG